MDSRTEEYIRMYCRNARIWREEQEAMVLGYRLLNAYAASSLDDLLPEPGWKQVSSRLTLRAPFGRGSGAERSRAYQWLNEDAEYRGHIDERVHAMRPYIENTDSLVHFIDQSRRDQYTSNVY